MEIYIDNKNLNEYDIVCLDYRKIFDIAPERENERVWTDKSGVDKNVDNVRYDAKDFFLQCYVKASNETIAYNKVKLLTDYMFNKGVFVLSLRDTAQSIRESYLCERSNVIVGEISIREQNSLYVFKLGLKDVNPNSLKYYEIVVGGSVSIVYDKGQTAYLYWGNGDRTLVSNSQTYTNDAIAEDGEIDIIVDIDKNAPYVPPLVAEFSASVLAGPKPLEVVFSDLSTGNPIIWSWNFGDGSTSAEQNPTHTYEQAGTYTIILQVFNDSSGFDIEEKTAYITVRDSYILINSTDIVLINVTDKLRKN